VIKTNKGQLNISFISFSIWKIFVVGFNSKCK
jgi:hypothetical protein